MEVCWDLLYGWKADCLSRVFREKKDKAKLDAANDLERAEMSKRGEDEGLPTFLETVRIYIRDA